MTKAMKEIARDVEKAIIENSSSVAGSASVARQMGGIPAFVTTNVLANGGTPRALTESLLTQPLMHTLKALI